MKPFNLERALAGDPVVTRDGRKALDFHVFKHIEGHYPLHVVIQNKSGTNITPYTINGKFAFSESECDGDLFMDTIKKTYWVNIYRDRAELACGNFYNTKDEALKNAHFFGNCLAQYPITIEE